MELDSLELTVCFCKDLKAFNFFQKLTLYAIVAIASDDPNRKLNERQQQQQRTHTDRNADGDGSNPEWYHAMRFDLGWVSFQDCEHLFLHFEFRHDGLILGEKLIGETRVPMKHLIQETDRAGIARFVNYEVRTAEGKPNGVVNLSYKVNGNGNPVVLGAPERLLVQYHNAPNQNQNETRIRYPTLEINSSPRAINYPPLAIPVNRIAEGYPSPSNFAPPPIVSSPSSGGYNYYYPPPFSPPPSTAAPLRGSLPAPLPPPYLFQVPPPPAPPVTSAAQSYPPPGPEVYPWPSAPNFQAPRW
ncbi:hypothetical protein L6164_009135 [Bauhinia variegata]|nr:hypothetical protein L6164_009135 [Bauhinia variegata]